jgi:hypothetical protein
MTLTENKNMKKTEIVSRLTAMLDIAKAPEIKECISVLIADLATAEPDDKGKLTYFVTVQERKLDPLQKYPKQMIEAHQILVETGKETLTMAEIKELMGKSAERLGTRQDPMSIYAFYQKRMGDEGWIGRAKERV